MQTFSTHGCHTLCLRHYIQQRNCVNYGYGSELNLLLSTWLAHTGTDVAGGIVWRSGRAGTAQQCSHPSPRSTPAVAVSVTQVPTAHLVC